MSQRRTQVSGLKMDMTLSLNFLSYPLSLSLGWYECNVAVPDQDARIQHLVRARGLDPELV